MLTRRALLSGAAPAAVLGLAGCANLPPIVVSGGINPAFVDAVVAYLQSTCAVALHIIPTATAIANVVASIFGPAAVSSVQLISGSVAAVSVAICAAIAQTPTAALRRRFLRSNYSAPVYIGTTPQGVVVMGYQG